MSAISTTADPAATSMSGEAPVAGGRTAAARRAVRVLLGITGTALDGFVVGFVLAYLGATFLSGAGRRYGLGPVIDGLVTLLAAVVVIGVLWGLLAGLIAAAGWIRDRLAPREGDAGRHRVRSVVRLPFRAVAAIPPIGVALMAAALVVVYVVIPFGIGGFVGVDGALSPWLWFGAVAGAAAGIAWAARRREEVHARLRRPLAAVGLGGGALVLATGLVMAVGPGPTSHLAPATAGSVPADLEDPGAPGPFAVEAFSYGSGTDRRPAFGTDARFTTPVVDGSAALDPIGGFGDEARAAWWGFGRDALPLNARVWMPEGDGPFPLVLVVHGNHAMEAPNEAGYAYLGEHLASRGFVVASVDESFLNGNWAGDYKGNEMDVRAWLLLLHLDQWRAWTAPGGPLEGRIDMDRVALIGHSRGGEAAAVAASWARLRQADPRLSPWPEGLSVRAVVAIAPSDGQIGHDTRLDGVDLLQLSGGHDADARGWSGIRQYNRTTVRDGGFKAALYAARANHGQFNTVWGAGDFGPWSGGILDLDALEPAADQQDVARTAIGAFLEASLHDEAVYRDLFRQPMRGAGWLPADTYAVRSDDGRAAALVDLQASVDPVEGLRPVKEGLTGTRAIVLPLRALQDTQQGRALAIEWEAGTGSARWGVEGLAETGLAPAGAGTALRLELADATRPASDTAPAPALDLAVEAWTSDGVRVSLPLTSFGEPPRPPVTRLVKHDLSAALAAFTGSMDLSLRSPAEQVVVTYLVDLDAFAAADPAFRVDRLDGVAISVPRAESGRLAVTAFGLLPPSP